MPVIEIQRSFSPEDPQRAIDRMNDRGHIARELEDVLNEAARIGEVSMKIYEPHGKTGELERHTTRQRAGIGIEGEFVARTGVERIPGSSDSKRGAYPDRGTGLYGPYRTYIYPTRGLGSPHSGLFMVFEIDGRRFVLPRVKGQKAQHFVRSAYRDVQAYLPPRLELMARRIALGH